MRTWLLVKSLWLMARPSQVLAVILVYMMGLLAAHTLTTSFNWTSALWGLVVILPLTISIHYVNEYADVETDALTERTRFSGGSGVLPLGHINRLDVLKWAAILFVVGLLLQIGVVIFGPHTWVMAGVWVFIAIAGWAYSLPPVALSWRGWGELDNALLGGMIMPIYGYLSQSNDIPFAFIAACTPFTILVFVNLLATTWPDRWADAAVGKYTLVTRWKRRHLRLLFAGLCVLAYVLLILSLHAGVPVPVVLGGLVAAPLSGWAWWRYTRQEGPAPAVAAMVVMMLGILIGWGVA